ncbi:EAL domain-containing protein [Parasulfuritortus cantonensis]|uniref:EAL domain-containing protein n=1 Tax=Parasulfuritortus cantonensis TaxID=2528202 RepID=A0A4R1B7R5_9PROT|nr:EAL domain-containing protein [Parasulfuritortus cantonensis]TCJ11933.1 EAL domain-containing protein [Parasulfuritortus cantonensis]
MLGAERKLITWLAAAVLALAGLLYGLYLRQVGQRLDIGAAQAMAAYAGVLQGYNEFADVTARWLLQDAGNADLVHDLFGRRPDAAGLLYRRLYPMYESLRAKQVRQLHFIDREGYSRLRMHAPDLYGDKIADLRPLVASVLATGQPRTGFEYGRVFSGFRFVYPVYTGERVAGAMEISLSFTAIRRLMGKTLPEGTTVRFLLRRDELAQALASGEDRSGMLALMKSMYLVSPINDGYLTEDLVHPLFGEAAEPLPGYAGRLERVIGGDAAVAAGMATGAEFSRHACLALDDCYLVNFLPVREAGGALAAYVVAYGPDVGQVSRVAFLSGTFLFGALSVLGLGFLGVSGLRARSRMRAISEHVGKGIYVIDRAGVVTYANPAVQAILGYRPDELVGQHAHDLLHLESDHMAVPAADCPIVRVTLNGGNYVSSAETFRCKDGTTVPVEVTASPIRELGEISGVVTVFSDIRERLAVESKLRQSDAAINQTVEGVMITDARNRVVAVNHAFTRMTGYTESDIVGMEPKLLRSGRHTPEFFRAMWASIAETGYWQGEVYNRRKNGSLFPAWLSIAAILDDEGRATSYVAVFNDISDIKEKEAKLDFLAHHDQLTGLPNRALFGDRLEHAIARAARNRRHLAVMFMDLDRFKQVNDSLGHDAGDRLLVDCAARLTACIREEDTLARQGGDEFVILVEDLGDGRDAAQVADKLIAALRPAFAVQGHSVYVGGSVGISLYPDDGVDVPTLLRHADASMYLAKQAGGNTYRFSNPSLARDAAERLVLEAELRRALAEDELVLHYQPKVELGSGRILAFEALLRWRHPGRGMLSPAAFLHVASEAGMMHDIGRWVMRVAAAQAAAWHAAGLGAAVSVNVDGSQLSGDRLGELVREVLRETGLDAAQLGLEITETAIMEQPAGVLAKLSQLRDLGVKLYIDDFGTGHSSLARLKQLPISVLKVDAAFVRDIVDDVSDRAIVRATVALGHELGLRVLAEGVETVEQLHLLREMGCDSAQGYHLSRPIPAAEATALLQAGGSLPL